MTRRAAMPGLAALLAGCGFHPIYAPGPHGALGPAQAELAAISVGVIPNRQGQLVRQALQDRFERGASGIARRYDLAVSVGVSGEGIGIQADASVTRIRVIGTAIYTLQSQPPQPSPLTTGTVRSIDGYDIINNQFFAADMNNDDVSRRIADALADQIVLRLASYFQALPTT